MSDKVSFAEEARRVLRMEAGAVAALEKRLDSSFSKACRLCLATEGRIVVTGMGKSGHIAGKIAATLASTGTPAFFMHPGEAGHGDLGMITSDDIIIALSNSGETDEIVRLLPMLKRAGAALIAMTGQKGSTLARQAAAVLDTHVEEEACPLNLAPTSSTTATLALGDALAVALLKARGLTPEEFARTHPGGRLGRRLLVSVSDVMRTGSEIPRVGPEASLAEGLLEMSRKGLGMTAVTDQAGRPLGVFTDGDLRRAMDRELDLKATRMAEVMTRGGWTVTPGMLASAAVAEMNKRRITALLVVSDGLLAGAFNIHDLMRAGVV
ncbi:MAG: KpsF/GutQ family sugar-phosphate isomerase [Gammaproteobacteria bacterium]|nr:KpsF/GutQ family sugar-phosphate isomerase [Gammaproteobacteria bacterium]